MSNLSSPAPLSAVSAPSPESSPPRRPSSTPPGSQSERASVASTSQTEPPEHCDDFIHCRASGGPRGNTLCDVSWAFLCPGLHPFRPTPPSKYGIIHPHPGEVWVCAHCMDHDTAACLPGHFTNKLEPITTLADANYQSGFRNQLCHRCIRDEVELYWLRQGTPVPPIKPGGDTKQLVEQWPIAPNSLQDLCICNRLGITQFQFRCHACRDEGFRVNSWARYKLAEDILTSRDKKVITGHIRCHKNGGTGRHLRKGIPDGPVTDRIANAGLRRRCPCGEKPKAQSTPEYITFCLGCSGVRIDPANLPPHLQYDNVMAGIEKRKGMRLSTQRLRKVEMRRTNGTRKAKRSHIFRVNIESAWIPSRYRGGGGRRGDHWVGGF